MVDGVDLMPDSSAQQAVDMLPPVDLTDYTRVTAAILQTLKLSPEAYCRPLWDIDFVPDYHPWVIGQYIRAAGLHWL